MTSPRMLTWRWHENGNIEVFCDGVSILRTFHAEPRGSRSWTREPIERLGQKGASRAWLLRRRVAIHLAKRFSHVD